MWRKKAISKVLCIALLIWGITCGLWDLQGPDEGRYVQIAKELNFAINPFLLTIHGEPYNQKPPFVFWIFKIMLNLCNGKICPWVLRIPSVLCAIGTGYLLYLTGKKHFSEKAGIYACILFLTTPIVLRAAPGAKLDMYYTFFITLSCCTWIMRNKNCPLTTEKWLITWGSLGLAFLIKGPLGIFIFLSIPMIESIYTKEPGKIRSQLHLGKGLILMTTIISGWLAIQAFSISPEFVIHQVKMETVNRVANGSHEAPWWYYFKALPLSITGIWFPALCGSIYSIWRRKKDLRRVEIQLLGWFMPTFFLLILANGKRTSYILPILPPMILFISSYFTETPHRWIKQIYQKTAEAMPFLSILTGIMIIVSVIITYQSRAILLNPYEIYISDYVPLKGILLFILFTGSSIYLKRHNKSLAAPVVVIASYIACCAMSYYTLIKPAQNQKKSSRAFSQEIEEKFPYMKELTVVQRMKKPSYHVYGDYKVIPYTNQTEKIVRYLCIRKEDLEKPQYAEISESYIPVWKGKTQKHTVLILQPKDRIRLTEQTPLTPAFFPQ